MNLQDLFVLVIFLLILYIFFPNTPDPDFDQIARCCWKTPQEVEDEYRKSKNAFPLVNPPCNKTKTNQIGGYIDAITQTRRTLGGRRQNNRVGQREGQVCNPHMPCHQGLDCYNGVCVVPRSNSFYYDMDPTYTGTSIY